MMFHGGGPPHLVPGAPIYRPMTAAENLKSYLSMAKPAAPLQASPKKRVIHQSLKPPLFVSEERKVGRLTPTVSITFSQITDPSVPETDEYRHYILCGQCDSTRLFRQLASLQKHRIKSCNPRQPSCSLPVEIASVPEASQAEAEISDTQPVIPAEPEDDIDTLIHQARSYLESLSIDEVRAEFSRSLQASGNTEVVASAAGLDKPALISLYLTAITGGEPETCDTVMEAQTTGTSCGVTDVTFEETESKSEESRTGLLPSACVETISGDWAKYTQRAAEILSRFPTISSHLLTVALLGNILPELKKARTRTYGTQTGTEPETSRVVTRSKTVNAAKSVESRSTRRKPTEKPKDRRSRRLALLRRR